MATIDIDAECLAECLPMLAQACRIVGSEAGPEGIVRLRIANEGLNARHVEATVTRVQSPTATTITIRLNPSRPREPAEPEVVAPRPEGPTE